MRREIYLTMDEIQKYENECDDVLFSISRKDFIKLLLAQKMRLRDVVNEVEKQSGTTFSDVHRYITQARLYRTKEIYPTYNKEAWKDMHSYCLRKAKEFRQEIGRRLPK